MQPFPPPPAPPGEKITIICGTDIAGADAIDACSDLAEKSKCGLFYTLSAANSFGAAVMAGNGPDFEDILTGIEKGEIKTLIALESDPLGMYPDRERVSQAVKKLETLIVMDYLSTQTARAADIFFPTAAYAEMDGIFVNNEGRAQAFARAYIPGIPVNTMGPKLHPPREFVPEVPGRSYPAWEYARDIARGLEIECGDIESLEAIRQSLAGSAAQFASIGEVNPESPGAVITAGYEYSTPVAPALAGEGLILYAIDLTFGTEEISTRSDKTQLKAPAPYVLMNNEDAMKSGLKDGERVKITSGNLSLTCDLKV